jgi:hypothetical protein
MKKVNKEKLFNHKACGVGEFISSELNNSLVDSYEKEFPGVVSRFSVSRLLIEKVFSMHDQVTGLQFAMGLKDMLNPNSSRILLIPCTHSEKGIKPIPLISDKGYYDLDGELVPLIEACQLIANQASYRKTQHDNLIYKDIERFSFVGRNMLMDLLNIPECESFSFQFGFENSRIATILSPLNAHGENINGIYADRMGTTPPCPCGEPCTSELVLNIKSNQEDLETIRNFRDHYLLNLENGEWLYEMYYFISPLVTYKINNAYNKIQLIETLHDKIKLMIQLIEAQEHDKTVSTFRNTLEELVDDYQEELIY